MTAPEPVKLWPAMTPELVTIDATSGIRAVIAAGIVAPRNGRLPAPPQKLSVFPIRIRNVCVAPDTIALAALLIAAPAKIRFKPAPTACPSNENHDSPVGSTLFIGEPEQ
ncbi:MULTISPECIES: hypothetical protein [unclassified Pseudomonas]|uniref:hypothetical protein n=1 Tax=Pseudomonas sp. A-R-26 TaxID=2832404 RepID=UPI001CBC886F|nr:hypothetical protein [Pseudomonas sp. A-R-26]